MAITIYCSSCGAKHVAEITKPKFCSACGDPIDKAFKKEQAKSVVKSSSRITDEDDEESFAGEIAQGSVSDFEVVVRRKLTLGDLSKMETPISRGNGGNTALPSDVGVTSKNFFGDLEK
jgi:hypothetical protein